MKKYRDAKIEVVSNGFIVTIGCQRVVAESAETMLKRFKEYYDAGSRRKEAVG